MGSWVLESEEPLPWEAFASWGSVSQFGLPIRQLLDVSSILPLIHLLVWFTYVSSGCHVRRSVAQPRHHHESGTEFLRTLQEVNN